MKTTFGTNSIHSDMNEHDFLSYYFKIKLKIENLINNILIQEELKEFEDIKYKYRIDYDRIYNSIFLKKYSEDIISENKSFQEWLEETYSLYFMTINIYNRIISTKAIYNEDLELLNKINRIYESYLSKKELKKLNSAYKKYHRDLDGIAGNT